MFDNNWIHKTDPSYTPHYEFNKGNVTYRLYGTERMTTQAPTNKFMINRVTDEVDEMIDREGNGVFGWGLFNAIGPKPSCEFELDEAKAIVEAL